MWPRPRIWTAFAMSRVNWASSPNRDLSAVELGINKGSSAGTDIVWCLRPTVHACCRDVLSFLSYGYVMPIAVYVLQELEDETYFTGRPVKKGLGKGAPVRDSHRGFLQGFSRQPVCSPCHNVHNPVYISGPALDRASHESQRSVYIIRNVSNVDS
jgi:hypothetical protein